MFLEVFFPALCVFALAHWFSKTDNRGLLGWDPVVYARAIIFFLRSPWGDHEQQTSPRGGVK